MCRAILALLLIPTIVACGILGGDEQPTIPGKIVFSAKADGDTYQLFVMNTDGSNVRQLTSGEYSATSPSWSPDGQRIAFSSDRQSFSGYTTLWVVEAGGGDWQPLVIHPRTGGPVLGDHPVWSPDGTKVVFDECINCEVGGGNEEIFLADLQAGTIDTLVQHPASDSYPTWSPSGNQISFISSRAYPEEGGSDIYAKELNSGVLTRLTQTGNAGRQLWYENGAKLIYWSNNELFSLELANKQAQLISLDFDSETGFRPLTLLDEGNRILLHVFSYTNQDQNHSLQVLNLANKQLMPITFGSSFNGADWFNPAQN